MLHVIFKLSPKAFKNLFCDKKRNMDFELRKNRSPFALKAFEECAACSGTELVQGGLGNSPTSIARVIHDTSIACYDYIKKEKLSLRVFDRHANLKYKYGNRRVWHRGYYVDTVGRNKEKIVTYIRNQLNEDVMEC